MTREKMTEMLSETICVTAEDARTALEASEWNVLDAAQRLLRARTRAAQAEAARFDERDDGRTFGSAVRGLFTRGRLAAAAR